MCELGGAEEAGDPKRLLGAFQRLVVGREVGLGERQLQVARAVCQAGILLTLERKSKGKEKKRKEKRTFCELAQEIYRKGVEDCDSRAAFTVLMPVSYTVCW